jgi:hypothetical protein
MCRVSARRNLFLIFHTISVWVFSPQNSHEFFNGNYWNVLFLLYGSSSCRLLFLQLPINGSNRIFYFSNWILFNFYFQPTKLYRIDRYTTPNCVKGLKYDWFVFNNSTLKITGGVDKLFIDGWFELFQDIDTSVSVTI